MNGENIFASVTHELRTPLHGIVGAISLINNMNEPINDELRDYLNTIDKCSQHLIKIIDDILNYTKLKNEKLTLNVNQFKFSEIVDNTLSLVSSLAKIKQQLLAFTVTPITKKLTFIGDSKRIQQILVNIITNSIKYTPLKGSINIKVWHKVENHNYKIIFNIKDTGKGIDLSKATNLFEPMVRMDEIDENGTGFGLSICKLLCKLMDGDIYIVNSELGIGTEIEFYILLKIHRRRSISICNSIMAINENIEKNELEQYNILIIDDSQICSTITKKLINKLGYTHCDVINEPTDNIIEHIKDHFYDIIFTDINLPFISGLTLASNIKKYYGNNHSPYIIALTADTSITEMQLLKNGIDSLLLKPCKLDDIKMEIYKFQNIKENGRKSPLMERSISLEQYLN